LLILIRNLPKEEQPKNLICIRKKFNGSFIHLIDFPDIITSSDLFIPFQSILKIEKFKDFESKLLIFNIYDDRL